MSNIIGAFLKALLKNVGTEEDISRQLDLNDPIDKSNLDLVKNLNDTYGSEVGKDHWARLYLDRPEQVDDNELWELIRLELKDEFGH